MEATEELGGWVWGGPQGRHLEAGGATGELPPGSSGWSPGRQFTAQNKCLGHREEPQFPGGRAYLEDVISQTRSCPACLLPHSSRRSSEVSGHRHMPCSCSLRSTCSHLATQLRFQPSPSPDPSSPQRAAQAEVYTTMEGVRAGGVRSPSGNVALLGGAPLSLRTCFPYLNSRGKTHLQRCSGSANASTRS